MAFVFRGECMDEEAKIRATQRLYQLLPNHKCPQKDCPFHPPEEATLPEEEVQALHTPSGLQPATAAVQEGPALLAAPTPNGHSEGGASSEDCCSEPETDGDEEPQLPDVEEEEISLTPDTVTPDDVSEPDGDEEQTASPDVEENHDVTEKSAVKVDGSGGDTRVPVVQVVPVVPVFTSTLKDRRVPLGYALHLICSVAAVPQPQVTWFKDGRRLVHGAEYRIRNKYGLQTLEVLEVSKRHGGLYRCQATNQQGSASCEATVLIEVEEEVTKLDMDILRPRFLLPLQDVVVTQGHDVTLTCSTTGTPLPTLTWHKDMLPMVPDHRLSVTSDDVGGSTLTIHNVRFSDAGLYLVRAKSKTGRCKSSAIIRVTAGSPDDEWREEGRQDSLKPDTPPSFGIPLPPSVSVTEGQPLRLDCSLQGYPPPIVTWQKEHRGLMYSQRHRIMFVGSLHTLEIRHTMALDSGVYLVRAHNSSGCEQAVCRVHVQPSDHTCETTGAPKLPDTDLQETRTAPMFIKALPEVVEVERGDDMRVDCLLKEGDDAPADDVTSATDKRDTTDAPDAPSSSGKPAAPAVLTSLQDLEVLIGDRDVRLECEVGGGESCAVTWYHDDNKIRPRQRYRSGRNGTWVYLIISQVESRDLGRYRCVLTNSAGIEHTCCKLSAPGGEKREAPVFVKPLRDMEVEDGDNLELVVEVKDESLDPTAEASE